MQRPPPDFPKRQGPSRAPGPAHPAGNRHAPARVQGLPRPPGLTPLHRLGALVALAGLGLMAYGWASLSRFTPVTACLQGSDNIGCGDLRWGLALILAGILLAPVLQWVRGRRH